MNFKQILRFALSLLLLGIFTLASSQTSKTNHPFSWKQTSDPWYLSKAFAYKYVSDDNVKETPDKKATNNRGPVCFNECKNSTAPGVCTEQLMKEKFKEVELPGINFPRGYSGVEYVTFEVQNNGRIYGYQVVKQPVVCPPCVQTAVNLVSSLDDWDPAVQDGIFVKSTVVVPIFFKIGAARQ